MAGSSKHSLYGQMECKEVQFANKLISNGGIDDTHQLTIECSNQSADRKLTIGVLGADQALLHDGSDLVAAKVKVAALGAIGTAAQNDYVFGMTNGGVNKKVLVSTLKSAIEHAHGAGSAGDIEVSNGSVFAAKTLGGAIDTISSAGIVVLKNQPTTAGTAQVGKFLQFGSGAGADCTGIGALSMVSCTASADVQAGLAASVRLGGATTTKAWRLKIDGDNLEFQRYDGSNWITKGIMNS